MLIHKPAYMQIMNGIKIHHYCNENHPEKTEFSPKKNHVHFEQVKLWLKMIMGAVTSKAAAGVGKPLKNPGMGFLSR
jgi:hypothetical protein